jgi:hypothetical protein
MATTTNYGWTTPDDTSLVKDGAAAIRTLGSSIDTTTKALNPSTTLGDIEYRSSTANTNTRLPIGTNGQFLTVTGGVPTWAGISTGGMTVIASGTLSGTEVSLTSISGSYTNLALFVNNPFVNTATTLCFRVNSNTGNQFGTWLTTGSSSLRTDVARTFLDSNGNYINMPESTGTDFGFLNITNYTSTQYKNIELGYSTATETITGIGFVPTNSAVTSIQIRGRNGTSTFSGGTYTLYGVQ